MKRRAQRGVTLVMVLMLLSVALLGGLMYARQGLTHLRVAGNLANNEAAAQATDIGVSTAFEALKALINDSADAGGWYFAQPHATDADGLPVGVNWDTAQEVKVGVHSVRYVVERHCRANTITDPLNQCLMSEITRDLSPADSDAVPVAAPAARTFRVTVRVTGPRNGQSWAQALLMRAP